MSSNTSKTRTIVVVARHGERQDYVSRDRDGINWVATAETPYNPPLTDHGHQQAETLGRHLSTELAKLEMPPISELYTSPLLRCRQTARGIQKGLLQSSSNKKKNGSGTPNIRVEYGLAESINEAWYRSWSLPGSDGTWGFDSPKPFDREALHERAKCPVQDLLQDWKNDTTIDQSYTPRTSIDVPYCLYTNVLESQKEQRLRMRGAVQTLLRPGETVLVCSHGGPVTHLFQELTGQSWRLHGNSTYCCYSIYEYNNDGTWHPWQVNESSYLHEVVHADAYVVDDTVE